MLRVKASIRLMTFDEQRNAGLQNPGLMLDYENMSYVLNAGMRDSIEVFTEGVGLYVLTWNAGLRYLGLDAYMLGHAEVINSVFLWKEQELFEVLGRQWSTMLPETKVQRLKEYLM